jgi:hypothetical protein
MMLTRADLWANAIYVFVCLLSVALALTIENAAIPGLIYWLLGPLQAWSGRWHGRKVDKLAAVTAG